ncbi:MAG: hypothetical protein QOD93_7144 [Acetobacteraceae bacterium]|nr:hypothetical protein [Acetobacteraceae bacterium]
MLRWTPIRLHSQPGNALKATRNVRRIEEHSNDHGRLRGAVGKPISPGFHPSPACLPKLRVRAGSSQTGGRVAFDLAFHFVHRGQKRADRLRALPVFIVLYEVVNLTGSLRRVFNQRGGASWLGPSVACLASRRASASCSRRRTASPGTVNPAASCASLLARASNQPAGTGVGVELSSIG